MKRRTLDKKLLLSKETIRNLMNSELGFVAGRGSECNTENPTQGDLSACDCSTSRFATDTCGACSTVQW